MNVPVQRLPGALGAIAAAVLLLSACGSSGSHSSRTGTPATRTGRPATSTASTRAAPATDLLAAAEAPHTPQFPATNGRTMRQMAGLAKGQVSLGPATGVFTPGLRRFAFALTTSSSEFVYAPTAIYLGSGPDSKAIGPFIAPADPMGVLPQYQSRQNAGPGGIKAIYGAEVPLAHAGTYDVLALTTTPHGLIGAANTLAVAASSAIPNVGQRPPDIATDTLASVRGDVAMLTTRLPPESMHSVSFSSVLGKKPIALLISTPELCTSRVCGPVTDVLVQLEHAFGSKLVFIHQEVYVKNNPKLGLRPQLKAFHLETEPWLFTIDRHGVIRARLEGAFGVTEARQALEAALNG